MGKKDKGEISPKKRIKGLELQLGLCEHRLIDAQLQTNLYKEMIVGLIKSSGLLKADSYISFEKGVLFFEDKLNGLYLGTFLPEFKDKQERLPMHIMGTIAEGSFYDQLKTADTTIFIEVPQLHLSGHAMPYIHCETLDVDSTLEEVLDYANGTNAKD